MAQNNTTQNCRIGRIKTYINGKEYWSSDFVMAYMLRRALDPNYGVNVARPRRIIMKMENGLIISE